MLASAGDPERAVGQQRYMKSVMPYYGITSAELKRLLRSLLADPAFALTSEEEWQATVKALWDNATHREERYAAQALLGHRRYAAWLRPPTMPLIRHLIITGAWWDHVDDLASHHVGSILRRDRGATTPVLQQWAVAAGDGAMWLRRTAIIAQLGHKADTDLALLTEAIDANLETTAEGERTAFGREFFIRKAIGWILRDVSRRRPDPVRCFVAEHRERMSGVTLREATKYLA